MQRIKIPFGRLTADAAGRAGRPRRGVLRPHPARHHAPGHPAALRPHRGHARHACAGWRRSASRRARRAATPCATSPPARSPASAATEAFDVTPYAHALTFFLLGHADTQDFGRKFKVAFSGCKDNACGLTNFHDLGAIARTREVERQDRARLRAGTSAAASARCRSTAKLFDEFLPEEELLPIAQAMCRVFARLGEKENRAARAHQVPGQEAGHRRDPSAWCSRSAPSCAPTRAGRRSSPTCTPPTRSRSAPPGTLPAGPHPDGFEAWRATNVVAAAPAGLRRWPTVTLPLGDLTSRAGARAGRRRPQVHGRHDAHDGRAEHAPPLGQRGRPARRLRGARGDRPGRRRAPARSATSRACPGTDTCKLGISSSRGLAGELRQAAARVGHRQGPERASSLHIKVSGCFNSCGQHHVADLGFLGVSRNVGGRRVPHFQLVVGGQWDEQRRLLRPGDRRGAVEARARGRQAPHRRASRRSARASETFPAFATRIGKKTIRAMVDELQVLPTYEEDPSFYTDWGDPREYTIGDMGDGECAGEVVPLRRGRAGRQPSASCSRRRSCSTRSKIDGAAERALSARCCRRRAR